MKAAGRKIAVKEMLVSEGMARSCRWRAWSNAVSGDETREKGVLKGQRGASLTVF